MSFKEVNRSVRKIDGIGLAAGEERFTEDHYIKDTLVIRLMPSPYAYCRIVDFDDSEARKVPGVVDIFSFRNIERKVFTTAGQSYPEPAPYDCVIFDDVMRHQGDKVCAVVAIDEKTALKAMKKIKVNYEVYEPLLDFEKYDAPESPRIHPEKDKKQIIPINFIPEDNIASEVEAKVGDVEKGFEESDNIREGEVFTQYAHHCPLENPSCIGYIDSRGRLVLITSTQVPFHVRRIVSLATGIPVRKIRVIKPRIGGGFGNKQEALLEPIVASIVWKLKRPAKLILKREETFVFSRTRHPFRIRYKVGYNNDGIINALQLNALQNTGAFGVHGLTVVSCVGSKILPLFNKIPNILFTGKAVYTNLPAGGAYRGYGATQGYFAYTQMIDQICEDCGIDQTEYYKRHCIKKGETSPIFEALGEGKPGHIFTIDSCELPQCIEKASEEIGWMEKKEKYHFKNNNQEGERFLKGIGMGCFMQGSSVPYIDMASVYMKMNDDGSFNLNMGATDLGTGSDTVLSQIAAEVLEVSTEEIIVISSDTDVTPFDVGAYASSTTYLSGLAVRDCAEKIKTIIVDHAAQMLQAEVDELECHEGRVYIKGTDKFVSYGDVCTSAMHNEDLKQIQATGSTMSKASPPPFSAHFAEIEIDTWTGRIKVMKYITATDCGTAINPNLAEGQVEGALVNGLSYALVEDYKFSKKGTMLNKGFSRYKIFTAKDLPEIKTILAQDSYDETGPFGAKSIAEVNINGPLPVISNAFHNATGKRFKKAPFNPEYVLKVLKGEE